MHHQIKEGRAGMPKDKNAYKLIAQNKKAYHDYFIEETYEAGIVLAGTEVKSIRQGAGSVKESFIKIKDGEAYIFNMHINPYEKGNIFNKDPLRTRKLLLHKREINRLIGESTLKGMTIVPLKVYIKGSLVKMEIGLARGKKLHDKRDDIAKKDVRRQNEREFKIKNL
ncbi:MAG: smpB [Clostridia bacterium]|jgi:SsrA-binding protein|nr:smpB [Clostridia bacterium]